MMKKYCPHVSKSVKFDVIDWWSTARQNIVVCPGPALCPLSGRDQYSAHNLRQRSSTMNSCTQIHRNPGAERSEAAECVQFVLPVCTNSAAAQQQHKHWTQERDTQV